MNWWVRSIKKFVGFELYWTLTCFSFYGYWMCPISAFASLVGIPVGITGSIVGLRICVITAGIKKHKSIIRKRCKMKKYC